MDKYFLQNTASEHLAELMDTLLFADCQTDFQVDLLRAIEAELRKRGDLSKELNEHFLQWEQEITEDNVRFMLRGATLMELQEILKETPKRYIELHALVNEELTARGEEIPRYTLSDASPDDGRKSEDILRNLVLSGDSPELLKTLDTLFTSDKVLKEQARLIFDIAETLKSRGIAVPYSENELRDQYETIMETADSVDDILRRNVKPQSMSHYLRLRKRPSRIKPHFIRTAGIIAAITAGLFVFDAVAYSAGLDIFGTMSRWTKNAVQFFRGEPIEKDHVKHDEYTILKDTLERLELNIDLPTYIPEGYYFNTLEPYEPCGTDSFAAWFKNGDEYFSIEINPMFAGSNSIYAENVAEETERYNGKYIIFYHTEQISAIWAQGFCEIQIQGNLTHEQLTLMLDSII